ncbi:hypothetical protein Tco_0098972 [Tanacetum coccineum]
MRTPAFKQGEIVRALLLDKKNQASAPAPAPAPVKAVELSCVTCGGAHSHQNCPATHGNVYRDNISEFVTANTASTSGSGTLPGNTVTNPREDLKGITTGTDNQEKDEKQSQNDKTGLGMEKNLKDNAYIKAKKTRKVSLSTRSQARRRRQPKTQVRQTSVESSNLEKPDNPPIVAMADNRTMAQLLEAPTEGYEDAIVIPEITANNFEIKHGLLNLVQNKQFFGHDKEDPHAHIRYFNKITSTMKIPNVPNTSVKLMLFPFLSRKGQPDMAR